MNLKLTFLIAVMAVTASCGSSAPGSHSNPDSGSPTGAAGAGGTFQAPSFTVSNLPAAPLAVPDAGDVVIDGDCDIDGKVGEIGCVDGGYTYALLEQSDPDHTKIAVFFMKSLRVEATAKVLATGPYAVAIVASGTVRINGSIAATVDSIYQEDSNAGGFSGKRGVGPGFGPGAGGGPDAAAKVGAGGGGYCGRGGPGGGAAGPGANGGAVYGNDKLQPLLGGSSGGTNDFGNGAGGGGALQIVAGVSIDVGSTGSVSCGGGGGSTLGGGGAGSGGAILLEAPMVRVAGVLAANGGGGGANSLDDAGSGENGRADGMPAKGGAVDNAGGNGSAAAMVDGSPGVYKSMTSGGAPNTGGAGGGGAGRIRINTSTGQADATGTLSPAVGPCATLGTLAAR